jgi:hypothetical protein
MGRCQKFVISFRKYNDLKIYVNYKKCASKLIFFNEKKIEKDSDNFDLEN